jgi:RNA polymerase sigma factor (sigma-70 family)
VEPAYRLALVMLHDATEAEDVVQEAALKAWRKLPHLRERTQIQPWFFAIVANQCRSVKRGRWWSTQRLPVLPERGVRMEEGAIQGIDLAQAFRHLSAEDRLALHLFFAMDLPLPEAVCFDGLVGVAPAGFGPAISRLDVLGGLGPPRRGERVLWHNRQSADDA